MEPEPLIEPSNHTYISQGLRLHYVDWGNPGAPPLILQHGGNDHCRSWDWVARRLQANYHVLAPDLRGHGDSQWSSDSSYSMPVHTFDFAELIAQRNLAPVTIVAHSLGASIALRYCGLYPERIARLVAIEGFMPLEMEEARAHQSADQRLRDWMDEQRRLATRRHKRFATLEEALARMQTKNKHLTAEQARHLTFHGLAYNDDGTLSWKFDNLARAKWPPEVTRDELHALWSRITCPTLLVYGQESPASKSKDEQRFRYFAKARIARIEGAGHWVHHDRLDAFMELIDAFLAENAPC